MKKLLDEFKVFITKGNIIDLAIGVIIGATQIVSKEIFVKSLEEKFKEKMEVKYA